MRLASRIHKLERHMRRTNPDVCPVCELVVGSDDLPPERIRLWIPGVQELGGPGEKDDPAEDFCQGCGRRVVFRVEFDTEG